VKPELPNGAALLLDVDGTLIDIAATPDAVVVPPDLVATLHRLRLALGGALAVVTGRPVAQVDALLGDAPHAVAGEHGAAIRHAPDLPVQRADLPAPPADWLARAAAVVARHPGTLLEPKVSGFVLHYRQAPEVEHDLHQAALAFAAELPGFKVLAAKMAWEVKPAGVDKGVAVAALMAQPPFLGRVPVYIGDDVTDEDGIRAAVALGGTGWLVPEVFTDPAGVRRWLSGLSCRWLR
jgi:trehalose 6-phosphate phosphatase